MGPACRLSAEDLPRAVVAVILPPPEDRRAEMLAERIAQAAGPGHERRVLVQVLDVGTAELAERHGADGLIAKGSESGGRVGSETTFILLQRLLASARVPVWAQGGVGLRAAAACAVAGAAGVVLDSQLALAAESTLAPEVRACLAAMDGSETVEIGGHRVYTRPDLPVARGEVPRDPAGVAGLLGASDLRSELLPVGQEGAFAGPLAKAHRTVGGIVGAFFSAMAGASEQASAATPLAPGCGVAAVHGTRFPVVQGPMTRVSDQPAFALAVARAGALPFLALALMDGDQVHELLQRTSSLLGELPWGVGILGFVPPDMRERQLAALAATPPPFALVAGGRPSALRPLEAAGITTYLHVPSPGLLDQFVAAGARHFVFEGRECGGHVGPRSSFALWESQISRLCAGPAVDEMRVLFAGGIHDALSGAMVSAMAAPLAARGAAVGVLMGTAYLFTDEAVASGAILPAFQEVALSCEVTELLETSPGHATRCVASAYVDAFRAERARLEREGASPQELWAALETMNLGRLRIAAKGLRREGDAIGSVPPNVQRHEGMFMIGEAAVLRREVTTLAALHEEVSSGSTAILAQRAAGQPSTRPGATVEPAHAPGGRPPLFPEHRGGGRREAAARSHGLDIAIVGMACAFPGARSAEELWANVVASVDSVGEVPQARWDVSRYYDPDALASGAGDRTPSKWGGFLPQVPFDALRYGIPPAALASIEPVQLLSLEVAARALADAGYAERELDRSRISVIFGAEAGADLASAYGFRAQYPQLLGELPAELDAWLPALTEDSFPGVLANVIAGRVANRLDLGGVNYTVDAACASSLAAVDLACKELAMGSSDMVLCGGADLHNGISDYLLFAAVHALSPTGRCRSFDASADGIALGEGVACVALKRRADAERDGDRIYAVIDGIGGSSDGRSLGLTAPRPEGQRSAIERAYARAGFSPADVGLIEAHGTGTVVGDRTELAVLTDAFFEAGAAPGTCTLGSIKSQIGHTKCAAGMAGLIKAAEAVYRAVRPPTLHISTPNPGYAAGESPFVFLNAGRPWLAEVRRAAVSAFGFGGTNFHVALSSYGGRDLPRHGVVVWPAELFCFRGGGVDTARSAARRLAEILGPAGGLTERWSLADLACTVAGSGSGPVRIAVVAESLDDLRAKLAGLDAGTASPPAKGVYVAGGEPGGTGSDGEPGGTGSGAVAFLFPGQGSQRPGMLGDLFVTFTGLRRYLALGGFDPTTMLPPAAFGEDERQVQSAALTDTRAAQPALGIAGLAMADLLGTCGVRPAMVGGHSYGELVALSVAGAIDAADLPTLSEARGRAMVEGVGDDPGIMAAVAAGAEEVAGVLAGMEAGHGVVVANDNAPGQVVVSGPTAGVERATALLKEAGLASRRLPVACAFHSAVVADAAPAFVTALGAVEVRAPRVPVWANTTAAAYPGDPAAVRATLARQLAMPVRFREQVEAMYASGARIFVETGPGRVLTQLVGRVLAGRPHLAVATDVPGEHGVRRFLTALAELAVNGVDVDTGPLFAGRAVRLDDAALAATRPPAWTVDGQLVRGPDGRPLDGGLRPVDERAGVVAPGSAGPSRRGREADATVVAYLESMRQLVDAQRAVVLSYLGAPASLVSGVPAGERAEGTSEGGGAEAPGGAVVGREAGPGSGANMPEGHPVPLGGDALMSALLALVSERTGYPEEMLAPDLDLEADLSIDSIKRLEILGDLVERIQIPAEPGAGSGTLEDPAIEELVRHKTLRAIVEWIDARTAGADGSHDENELGDSSISRAPSSAGGALAHLERSILRPVAIAPPDAGELVPPGGEVAIVGGGSLGSLVADRLRAGGRRVRELTGEQEDWTPSGAMIDMSLIEATERVPAAAEVEVAEVEVAGVAVAAEAALSALLARVRDALAGGAHTVLVVSAMGGAFGRDRPGDLNGDGERLHVVVGAAGVRGFVKTAALEYPGTMVHAVDLDPAAPEELQASQVLAELAAGAGPGAAVGYDASATRVELRTVPGEVAPGGGGIGTALGSDAVVLVTGGARGIGARAAVALAVRSGCTVVLAGRTVLDDTPEPDEVAGAAGAVSLRRVLAGGGAGRSFTGPAEVERECRRILANREARATMEQVVAAGASVHYEVVDTSDLRAVVDLVEGLYVRFGRIDGVVHAAGVIEDRLLAEKTPESFRRVFATKVTGAVALARALRDDLRFFVLYASVSGVFGNRGQIDYAAANDALGVLAHRLSGRWPGRVAALAWGPWAGGGMVTPELARAYARRGIGFVAPEAGVDAFLAEVGRLLAGAGSDPEVVLLGVPDPESTEHDSTSARDMSSVQGAVGAAVGAAGAARPPAP